MTTTADLLARARASLTGVARERLGEDRTSRWRRPRIVPVGAAWHLGVLLLTDDGVLATGEVLRAAAAVRRGYPAESARVRAERRAQARRGGFDEGEVVHVGWRAIDVGEVDAGGASGPLALIDATPRVRWSPAGGWMPLERYLDEQIALAGG